MTADNSTITVPPELKAKFPDLVALILASESMNTEERQYWINILPVMTPDQLKNLQEILQNEKNQLAAIDAKYEKEMTKLGSGASVQDMQKSSQKKRQSRTAKESAAEEEERRKEQEILNAIAELEG